MRTIIILNLLIITNLIFCQKNNDSDSITVWYYDLAEIKTHYNSVDLSAWDTLNNIGLLDNSGLKTGFWTEYPIDTSILTSESNIRNDSSITKVYKPNLVKMTGNYDKGKKNGKWNYYEWNCNYNFWLLKKTIEYVDDVKDGYEIHYFPWIGADTSLIITYKKNSPTEITKYNSPGQIESKIKKMGKKVFCFYYNNKGEIIKKERIE